MIPKSAQSQSAVVTNNANPSAAVSTNTTGGTNINYQTNNQWSNEMGFAPGVFCRTPTFYMGGGTGQNVGNTMDTLDNGSYQYTHNYNANIGVLVPFGSSVQRDCKRLAEQIAKDREISSDLSMIRACASLDNEGIIVDASKFPTLSRCVIKSGQPPSQSQELRRCRPFGRSRKCSIGNLLHRHDPRQKPLRISRKSTHTSKSLTQSRFRN